MYKNIPGYPSYFINKAGKVIREIKQYNYGSGGSIVYLNLPGHSEAHRLNTIDLVALAFTDTNKSSNRRKRLTDNDYIYIMTNPLKLSGADLARRFKCTSARICQIQKGNK